MLVWNKWSGSAWQKHIDCQVYKSAHVKLCSFVRCQCCKNVNRGHLEKYVVHRKSHWCRASAVTSIGRIPINLQHGFSSYLAKLPFAGQQKGIVIMEKHDMYWLSYPKLAGHPPAWTSEWRLINCSTAQYGLHERGMLTPQMLPSCGPRYAQCLDGSCILQHHRCDSVNDCNDASDEYNCPSVCTKTAHDTICNATWPEPICVCPMMYYQRSLGDCIPIWTICNNLLECLSEVDDTNCSSKLCRTHPLMPVEIAAHPLNEDMISTDLACVYITEFSFRPTSDHGLNLKHCYYHECPGMYKCINSYCIPYHKVCNGKLDCPSGEEEINCDQIICPGLLKCIGDHVCVSWNDICNGYIHCPWLVKMNSCVIYQIVLQIVTAMDYTSIVLMLV